MSQIFDAIENVGELFIMGFSGKTLAPHTRDFLKKAQIGGIILFSKNYENPSQVCQLINDLQDFIFNKAFTSVQPSGIGE